MKNIDFFKGKLIAHRGLFNNKVPENSIDAFKLAIKKGYIIELDLHILKDNNIVVFHDDNLFRMTDVNKNIKDCTYNEIKNLKLNNTDSNIPLFKDVLDIVKGKVPLLIELKYDTKVGILEQETMRVLNGYNGKYAIMSFNPLSVLYFRTKYPNVIRGQLSCNIEDKKYSFIKRYLLKNMSLNFITKSDFVAYCIESMPNKKIEEFRKKGLVIGWTIRSKEDLENAKMYFDSFICENIL